MPLRVTFLGTAGAIPTTARNPSSVFVAREGEGCCSTPAREPSAR